ncbi:hypothetical protein [Haloferax marisrubri]|uniref:Uncharacterized protein n=1 Tax=Haloferax marisrubri TaxID=1544719 RepID=A0A2P4NVT7_9EURY|nr:hypothetical protein [Haloferax marisrubri]POG57249.1 hypothetical protein AUR65_001420 [Haloferax marisrubri]
MTEYIDYIADNSKRPWIVANADGEHTREDAPVTAPECVTPITIEELEKMALDLDDEPLAIFAHQDNNDLLLWVWNAIHGIIVEYQAEPGFSIPYWTSQKNLRDVLEHAVNEYRWELSNVPERAQEAMIDAVVETAEESNQ